MSLKTDYATPVALYFSQASPGEAIATLDTGDWSSISGLRAGYRIFISDTHFVDIIEDPRLQSADIKVNILDTLPGVSILSGDWQVYVPSTRSVVEYLPRHVKNTLILPEYFDTFQQQFLDELHDSAMRLRNLRRWDVMDQEYLDVFLQTMGMFFKSEAFDVETKRRFVKELPKFLEISGTQFFSNYLSFVAGADFTPYPLWSNDYSNFIKREEIPGGDETGWYPTNHVQLDFSALAYGTLDPNLVIKIFYVLASAPLVVERIEQTFDSETISIIYGMAPYAEYHITAHQLN
jgi:hypothetical protein